MAFQPPFLALRQIPNPVSIIIANKAIYIIGFTGEITAKNDVANSNNFVFKVGNIL